MSHDDLLALLRKRIAEAGSKYRFCAEHGLHQGTVCRILNGSMKPTNGVIVALGLRRVISYEPR